MRSKRQMLVKMDNGDSILFDLECHGDYVQFMYDVDSLFKKWVRIGAKAMMRKRSIISCFYFPNGYDNKQIEGEDGQED